MSLLSFKATATFDTQFYPSRC